MFYPAFVKVLSMQLPASIKNSMLINMDCLSSLICEIFWIKNHVWIMVEHIIKSPKGSPLDKGFSLPNNALGSLSWDLAAQRYYGRLLWHNHNECRDWIMKIGIKKIVKPPLCQNPYMILTYRLKINDLCRLIIKRNKLDILLNDEQLSHIIYAQ